MGNCSNVSPERWIVSSCFIMFHRVSSAPTFLFSLATNSDGVSAVSRGRESCWHFPKGNTFEYLCTSVLSSLAGLLVPQFQAVGANGEVPGTDDLDAGAKRVNPEVKTISAAMDDKAGQTETLGFSHLWTDVSRDAIYKCENIVYCHIII